MPRLDRERLPTIAEEPKLGPSIRALHARFLLLPVIRSRLGFVTGLLCPTVLTGCATTDEQRFPLDYVSGQRAAMQPGTAREAFQAYQRMGADLERQGRFAQAAIAYSNAYSSARALGRLQDALEMGQKAVEMAERSRGSRAPRSRVDSPRADPYGPECPQRAIPILRKGCPAGEGSRGPNSEASSYIWLSSGLPAHWETRSGHAKHGEGRRGPGVGHPAHVGWRRRLGV